MVLKLQYQKHHSQSEGCICCVSWKTGGDRSYDQMTLKEYITRLTGGPDFHFYKYNCNKIEEIGTNE